MNNELTTLFDITIGLENLLNEAYNLNENIHFVKIAKTQKWKLKENNIVLGDIQTYRSNIKAYKQKLKYYAEHYAELDKFGDTKTTDKFFTEIVAPMRPRAEKSFKVLKKTFEKYENNQELLLALDELKVSVNEYIKTCRRIIKFNPRLENLRKLYSFEKLVDKYNLFLF